MTKEMIPSKGSGVLETTDEKDSNAVTTPLIDPQFLKEKAAKSTRKYSVGDIYLAASCVSLSLEFVAYGYALWCTRYPQNDLTLFKVSMAFFALYAFLSAIFIANSAIELRDLIKRRSSSLTSKEKHVKHAAEWLTVLNSALYLLLYSLAIVMACNIHNALLQYSSLLITIVAPMMSSTGGFLRACDTYLSYKKERDAIYALEANGEQAITLAQKKAAVSRRAKSYFVRASLYGVVATIRFLGLITYIWQAFILVGNTHKLFYVTETPFLATKVTLATVLLILVIVERVLKRTAEPDLAAEQQQVVSLTDEQLVFPNACTSDGITQLPSSDDTAQLLSNEWEIATVTPCAQKALDIT